MKGRAHQILVDFMRASVGSGGPFRVARLILKAQIIPEEVTEEMDCVATETRLEKARQEIMRTESS